METNYNIGDINTKFLTLNNLQFKGGTLIDLYTDDFIEVCRRRSGGVLNTPSDILKEVNEWHPLMQLP